MPFTLAEHAIAQTNTFKKGVFVGFTQESLIGDLMSWRSTGELTTTGIRYDGVIRPSWLPINAPFPENTVRGKNLSAGVYMMGTHIDIPNVLEKDGGVKERPSTRQTMLAIKGAAYELNNVFINGDQAGEPNQFEGIEKIIGNLASSQSIGATALDIRPSASPTDATMQAFIDRIDEAIYAVDGHKPDFALCSSRFGLTARSVFRRLKLVGDHYDWVKGMPFGNARQTLRSPATRPMFVYNDIPFYDIGPAVDENGTETAIIANDYTESGAFTAATRVYFVKQGTHSLEGMQYAPLSVKKIAETLHDKPVQRHRLEWVVGLGAWSKDCLSVARGIRV
ncbi:MAG: hypothetical protein WC211_03605 [Dehalococcoidia bacterium]